MWEDHIEDWLRERGHRYDGARGRSVEEIERILIKDKWEKAKYKSHMKKDLYKYLDAWFVLAIKKMPPVATSLRRNPEPLEWCPNCSCFSCQQVRDYY